MCILHSRFSEFSARPTNGSFPVFFPHPFINRGNTFSTLQSNIFFRIYRILEDNNLGDHYHISHHFWKLLVEIIRPRYLSALSLISPLRLFYSAIYIFFSSLFFGITYKLDWMRIPDFQKQRFTWCSLSRFLQEQPLRYCLKDTVRENWSRLSFLFWIQIVAFKSMEIKKKQDYNQQKSTTRCFDNLFDQLRERQIIPTPDVSYE